MTDGQSEGARMSEETPLRELVERHVVVAMNERLRAVESQVKFVLETLQPSDTEELAERVTRDGVPQQGQAAAAAWISAERGRAADAVGNGVGVQVGQTAEAVQEVWWVWRF